MFLHGSAASVHLGKMVLHEEICHWGQLNIPILFSLSPLVTPECDLSSPVPLSMPATYCNCDPQTFLEP